MKHFISLIVGFSSLCAVALGQETLYYSGQGLLGSPVALGTGQDGETQCYTLCATGGWVLDYWADESGGQIGDTITFEITAGGTFKINEGGSITNHYQVYDTITVSAVIADNGVNPSTIDGAVTGSPDGLLDPIWLMGHFTACLDVELPNGSSIVDITKYGQIVSASINGNPISTTGLAYSFGTTQNANHTYTDNPTFTVNGCVIPEPSTTLLGAAAIALAALRRKRA